MAVDELDLFTWLTSCKQEIKTSIQILRNTVAVKMTFSGLTASKKCQVIELDSLTCSNIQMFLYSYLPLFFLVDCCQDVTETKMCQVKYYRTRTLLN